MECCSNRMGVKPDSSVGVFDDLGNKLSMKKNLVDDLIGKHKGTGVCKFHC